MLRREVNRAQRKIRSYEEPSIETHLVHAFTVGIHTALFDISLNVAAVAENQIVVVNLLAISSRVGELLFQDFFSSNHIDNVVKKLAHSLARFVQDCGKLVLVGCGT